MLCVLHGFFFKLTLYKFDTEGVSPLIASRVKKVKNEIALRFFEKKVKYRKIVVRSKEILNTMGKEDYQRRRYPFYDLSKRIIFIFRRLNF